MAGQGWRSQRPLGPAAARVTFTLRDRLGTILTTGHGEIASGAHFAKLLNQLKEVAPDFIMPGNFSTSILFGSLHIASDQPLSVMALRLTMNQRGITVGFETIRPS
jgi:hypothetical protein